MTKTTFPAGLFRSSKIVALLGLSALTLTLTGCGCGALRKVGARQMGF
jgi:hypothetical protein